MNKLGTVEGCLSFINCQIHPPDHAVATHDVINHKCAITISRESGCGAHAFAEKLVAKLQPCTPPEAPPWTIFDKNLVEQVLQDHHLPERLAQYMPEDRVLEIDDIMDELFGLRPASWTLVKQISETILHLAELGNVIIVGRGANIITAQLPHVLHVRLIGSLKHRIENMQAFEGLSLKEARNRVRREDNGRKRYVKKHLEKDVSDPSLYHLVINTDLITSEEGACLVANLALNRKATVA